MKVKNILDEDFVNYKKPSMFIAFPYCDFKCCKEAGCDICQNLPIVKDPDINVSPEDIVQRYINNPITKAIVCGGLEPFDSFAELKDLVNEFRKVTDDDIVIYTGYNRDEINDECANLAYWKNIIIKFGRFIPNQPSHIDELLGIELASPNQKSWRIS